MSDDRRFEQEARRWLELGPTQAPDRAVRAVLLAIETTPQQRVLRPMSRFQPMYTVLKLAAAALFLLAIGIGVRPLLPGPAAPAPSPSPSPTAPPAPLPLSYAPIDPGTYALGSPVGATGSPLSRMTATVPEGWAGIRGNTFAYLFQSSDDGVAGHVNLYLPDNFFVDGCEQTARWDPPLGPTVDDFVTALVGVQGYQTTERREVTLDGYPGVYVVQLTPASVAGCTDDQSCIWETRFNETAACYGANGRVRLWVLDIDGERVVIELPDDDVTPAPTATDPVSRAEQQQVFDSLRIAPAPGPVESPSASAAS